MAILDRGLPPSHVRGIARSGKSGQQFSSHLKAGFQQENWVLDENGAIEEIQ